MKSENLKKISIYINRVYHGYPVYFQIGLWSDPVKACQEISICFIFDLAFIMQVSGLSGSGESGIFEHL